MTYYYFGATLPALSPTGAPPWSVAEFTAAAARQLSAQDLRELLAVLAGGGESPFALACSDRAAATARLAARARAERTSRDASAFADAGVPDLQLRAQVQDAFLAADPLERERRLDALRWRWLEGAAARAPFGAAAVFAHGLMLQMAWRWHARTVAAGREQLLDQQRRALERAGDLQFTFAEAGS